MIPIADDQVSCCAKGPTAPAEGCLKAQSGWWKYCMRHL